MGKSLQGKTILVTGGSRGIGKAIAQEAAAHGANVIITYRSEENTAKQFIKELQAQGCKAAAIAMDYADKTSIETCCSQALKEFSKIDILVNNAATLLRKNFFLTTSDDLDKVYKVNLRGPFILSKLVVDSMLLNQVAGVIVNISSDRDTTVTNNTLAYQISKAGLHMFTKVLAKDLAPNIRAITISPGMIKTDMHKDLWQDDPQKWQSKCDKSPLKRAGTAQEIAKLVVFVSSDKATYMTGNQIVIDGGRTIDANHQVTPKVPSKL